MARSNLILKDLNIIIINFISDLSGRMLMNEPSTIALALSGGGFRATLFHLGVIRYLFEIEQLKKVRTIASVSGGSILAAHLALNWETYLSSNEGFSKAADEIVAFTRKDVRGRIVRRWVLGHLLAGLPFLPNRLGWSRVSLLQRYYDSLYQGKKLAELGSLPGRPDLRILATSLTTGDRCSFSKEGFRHPEVRRIFDRRGVSSPESMHDQGYGEPILNMGHAKVAMAVAASSAFPPLFPPILLSKSEYFALEQEFHDEALTDGGVYDNLGVREIQALDVRRDANHDLIIVSDAGAIFGWQLKRSFHSIVSRTVRATDIVFKRLDDEICSDLIRSESWREKVLHCRIDRMIEDESLSRDCQAQARLTRTDLDEFSPAEILVLVAHGYVSMRHTWQEKIAKSSLNQSNPRGCDVWLPRIDGKSFGGVPVEGAPRAHLLAHRLWSARDPVSWLTLILVLSVSLALIVSFIRYLHDRDEAVFRRTIESAKQLGRETDEDVLKIIRNNAPTRPLRPGLSVSHPSGNPGSICCIVRDGSGKHYVLGGPQIFAPIEAKKGDPIVQPAVIDSGKSEDHAVARLEEWSTISFDRPNKVAGAIAEIIPGISYSQSLRDHDLNLLRLISSTDDFKAINGVSQVQKGDDVIIVGRGSVPVRCKVIGVGLEESIPWGDRHATFEDIIHVQGRPTLIVEPNDAGATVLDKNGMIVGMVLVGSLKVDYMASQLVRALLDPSTSIDLDPGWERLVTSREKLVTAGPIKIPLLDYKIIPIRNLLRHFKVELAH